MSNLKLMDGTSSKQSYVVLAEDEDFMVGIQPTIGWGITENKTLVMLLLRVQRKSDATLVNPQHYFEKRFPDFPIQVATTVHIRAKAVFPFDGTDVEAVKKSIEEAGFIDETAGKVTEFTGLPVDKPEDFREFLFAALDQSYTEAYPQEAKNEAGGSGSNVVPMTPGTLTH